MLAYQQGIIILMAVIATVLTRFIPFILFPSQEKTPENVKYLGNILPPAIFGLLVVYTVKDINILTGSHGISEAIGILTTAGIHYWKREMILSILTGTIVYVLLINLVF